MVSLPTVNTNLADFIANKVKPLVYSNKKLGHGVWHFSLPAILTCPGRTDACEAACYADKGHYHQTNVKQRLAINNAARMDPRFVSRVTLQIQQDGIRNLRIHPSGDFDTVGYIEKWDEIATRRQHTQMWAYTRSWRPLASERAGEDLLSNLALLSRRKNVQMFFSCDNETGAPPRIKGIKRAFMMVDDTDVPKYNVDLVFRVKRAVKMITVKDTLVCPAERQKAKAGQSQVTCAQCRICIDRVDWLDGYNAKLRNPQE